MARYINPHEFDEAARNHYAFLLEVGFFGPAAREYQLLFTSQKLSVNVVYDDRDGRVMTLVDGKVGERNPNAGLRCLYVEAGFGPAQHIRDIARSPTTLETALASQSSALRKLIPVLNGNRGGAMLIECHGR